MSFYHIFDEAFRVLKSNGHLEIYERSYNFVAGQLPIPISNPDVAPQRKKHSFSNLEKVYEDVSKQT